MEKTKFTFFLIISFITIGSGTYIQGQKPQIPASQKETKEIVLPPLPYKENELEPYISAQTMMLHYGKHLKGYIDNVNRLVKEKVELAGKDLESIVKQSEGSLYNNAAQTWNHLFYFDTFSPHAQHTPSGKLAEQINRQWGNFDNFKKAFTTVANSLFGSGWVWLVKNGNDSLEIIGESNAGNILKGKGTPLLGVDVWEHAYYLDYQNRRSEHIDGLWNIIDWSIVDRRYNTKQL